MKVSDKEIRYIADLAHLNLSNEEIEGYRGELEGILEYVDKLSEIDTEQVEPMSHMLYPGSESKALREDEPQPSLDRDLALSNAPQQGAGHFKVPLVIAR